MYVEFLKLFLNQQHLDKEINICGMLLSGLTVKRKGGGGLVVYILKKLEFIHRQDLEYVNVESIWIEICPRNSKGFLLANVYRPPSASIDWFHNLGINWNEHHVLTLILLFWEISI